ncbi:MAG TPA: S8 family serine peptidase [Chthoniobacterales bacterium]|nr:S8 family serine peptidase [Chthoniobacterales bacterium]
MPEALLNAIRAAGGEIINSVPEEDAVRAFLPVESAEAIAARPDVKFIRPASIPFSNAGSVNSQGDTTHRSAQARSTFGANGAGIKVGVLSTSINDTKNSLGKSVNSGDLPGDTRVLQGQAGANALGGEGLAMLEIVHDLAPASKLYYATGFSGEAQMAQNIRNLAASGCRIIIDDIGYYNETPFQDGKIAKAINAVSADGVLYFSSAANSGNLQSGNSGTWEGNFKKGGFQQGFGEYHAFKPGVFTNVVTQETGASTFLFWSDPLGGSANDYDLFVFDSFGNLVSASDNPQQGTQDPIEFVDAPRRGEQIVIYKFAGAVRYLHLNTNRGRLQVGTGGQTKGHNASGAANAFCVAAAPAARSDGGPGSPNGPFPGAYNSNSKVETFSSDGFRRIFFNANGGAITPGNFTATGGKLLIKPDITAADGVVTTLPFDSGLNPFFGTSAAAPHAGAIAAQVLSRRPSATPGQVRQALNASAIDILVSGIDRTSGRGIVMAPGAVQAINSFALAGEEAVSEGDTLSETDGVLEPQ